MSLVLTIRNFPTELSLDDIATLSEESKGCMESWSANWQYSFRDPSNNRILCFFAAPDAESVRIGIRQAGWTGEAIVKSMTVTKARHDLDANVIVERHFDEAVEFDNLQNTENQHAWCLAQHQVIFIESYFSLDRKTMICLYHAPDAESVRTAQRQATMPFDRVWACQKLDQSALS